MLFNAFTALKGLLQHKAHSDTSCSCSKALCSIPNSLLLPSSISLPTPASQELLLQAWPQGQPYPSPSSSQPFRGLCCRRKPHAISNRMSAHAAGFSPRPWEGRRCGCCPHSLALLSHQLPLPLGALNVASQGKHMGRFVGPEIPSAVPRAEEDVEWQNFHTAGFAPTSLEAVSCRSRSVC